jgi:hypothetical protein
MAAEQGPRRGSDSSKRSAAKSTTKKSTTKKSTTKETTAQEPGSKKASTPKSASSAGTASRATAQRSAPRAEAPRRMSGAQVAEASVRHLTDLTANEVEGVTGLERNDDGWTVQLDVLELRRVPNTTDVLATYEVRVDSQGELESYRRVHRYVRGTVGEDGA